MGSLAGSVFYRYFFFGWLFKDANRGTLFERAAATRHNREQSRWLPTYAYRWVVVSGLLFGIGWFLELIGLIIASAFFFVGAIVGFDVLVVIVVAFLGFKFMH